MKEFIHIQTEVQPWLERLNRNIAESLTSPNPLLNNITTGFLSKTGKQIRPIFTFLVAQLLGQPNTKTIDGASALELLHNASLVHDDVVDNSDKRRNVPTINKIWDNRIAVLVGDYFVSTALTLSLRTQDLNIVSAIGNLGCELSTGELDQIDNAQRNVLDEEAYIATISRKTASLFVACAKIAAYSVGATDNDIQKLSRFALLLGICFQIKDDTFDYFPQTESSLGKPVGADLLDKKISLPLLNVLINDQTPAAEQMKELCFKDDITPDDIKQLIEYTISNGGIEYANNYMRNLFCEAKEILKDFDNRAATDNLLSLFRYAIERNH